MTHNESDALYGRSFFHRLNQIYAEAGQPPIMPDDWEATEAMDDMASLALPYDDEPVARRIAGHLVHEHEKAWDAAGSRFVYDGWCAQERANLFVLSHSNLMSAAVAVETVENLRQVKADLMGGGPYKRCAAVVNRQCSLRVGGMNAVYPVEFLAVRQGMYVCAFIVCLPCFQHVKSGAGFNDEYIGPTSDADIHREAGSRGWG